jgi:hypothetical protein
MSADQLALQMSGAVALQHRLQRGNVVMRANRPAHSLLIALSLH